MIDARCKRSPIQSDVRNDAGFLDYYKYFSSLRTIRAYFAKKSSWRSYTTYQQDSLRVLMKFFTQRNDESQDLIWLVWFSGSSFRISMERDLPQWSGLWLYSHVLRLWVRPNLYGRSLLLYLNRSTKWVLP